MQFKDCKIPALPRLKGKYHFRLGIPSCVLPADILPNVEAFAPWVDDIELTLFESPDKAGLPAGATLRRLRALAEKYTLTYTVHLPIDRTLGNAAETERNLAQQQLVAIMRLIRPLQPFAWILHLDGLAATAAAGRVQAWQKNITELLPPIIAEADNSKNICVENLLYPFDWCLEIIETFKLGLCLDSGHLLATGQDVARHLSRFLPQARIMHLHGRQGGKDHQALDTIPESSLRQWLRILADFKGVLTLEMFNLPAIFTSLQYLEKCLDANYA